MFKEFEIVDLTNKEEFYNLAKKVKNMTAQSGRTVFIDVDPETIQKTDFTAREQQFEGVLQNVVRTARAGLENDPDQVNTQNALNNLKSSDAGTKADARDYLLSRFITPEFIESLETENPSAYRGLSENYIVKPYLKFSETTTTENSTTRPIPTSQAIAALQNNPTEQMIRDFNNFYGPNAADQYLD